MKAKKTKTISGKDEKPTSEQLIKAVRDCRTRMAKYTPEQRVKCEKYARELIQKGKNRKAKSPRQTNPPPMFNVPNLPSSYDPKVTDKQLDEALKQQEEHSARLIESDGNFFGTKPSFKSIVPPLKTPEQDKFTAWLKKEMEENGPIDFKPSFIRGAKYNNTEEMFGELNRMIEAPEVEDRELF